MKRLRVVVGVIGATGMLAGCGGGGGGDSAKDAAASSVTTAAKAPLLTSVTRYPPASTCQIPVASGRFLSPEVSPYEEAGTKSEQYGFIPPCSGELTSILFNGQQERLIFTPTVSYGCVYPAPSGPWKCAKDPDPYGLLQEIRGTVGTQRLLKTTSIGDPPASLFKPPAGAEVVAGT